MRLSEAAIHEETEIHRSFVNALNDVRIAPSSPLSPTQRASDLPFSHHNSSPLPRSSPPVYSDDAIPAFYTSAGPWLPEDDQNEIFDDYGGPYGAQMPSPEDPEVSSHGDKPDDADLSDPEGEVFEGEVESEEEAEGEEFEGEVESDGDAEGQTAADRRARAEGATRMGLDGFGTGKREEGARMHSAGLGKASGSGAKVGAAPTRDERGAAYFGPSDELEDLTAEGETVTEDDWWPWMNREVRCIASYLFGFDTHLPVGSAA